MFQDARKPGEKNKQKFYWLCPCLSTAPACVDTQMQVFTDFSGTAGVLKLTCAHKRFSGWERMRATSWKWDCSVSGNFLLWRFNVRTAIPNILVFWGGFGLGSFRILGGGFFWLCFLGFCFAGVSSPRRHSLRIYACQCIYVLWYIDFTNKPVVKHNRDQSHLF